MGIVNSNNSSISLHAQKRAEQAGISPAEIFALIESGEVVHRRQDYEIFIEVLEDGRRVKIRRCMVGVVFDIIVLEDKLKEVRGC